VHAMSGLPLPLPRQHSPAIMLNLLGDIWFDSSGRERTPDWCAVLALPGAHLHLYGKTEARRGRKMGHLTLTGADLACRPARVQLPACSACPAWKVFE
jgi:5-(carboxyamino)imidazole ribonucleotide synthase